MKKANSRSSFGFTLAEVLITLGIIGVIAALTIPSLLQNMQERSTMAALKKAYSTLSAAHKQAVKENGTPDNWDVGATGTPNGSENILNMLAPYLNIAKKCDRNAGCFPNLNYKTLSGDDDDNFDSNNGYAKAKLADGSLISIITYDDCTWQMGSSLLSQEVCGEVEVDINGFKGPNQYGTDTFIFTIGKNGIAPVGTKLDDPDNAYPFDSNCKDKTTQEGYGCAAWVIYNENMDYLKCNTLSWDGPTKCN